MKVMTIDLEMNQPSGTIIQVGAVVGDVTSGRVLDKICLYINPNETLSEEIVSLTGITQEQVNRGIKLEEAYLILKDMHTKHKCFRNLMTWGGNDADFLRQSLKMTNSEWAFGRRCIDIKTLYQFNQVMNGKSPQGGLAKTLHRLGGKFIGKKHNALDDAKNTFQLAMIMKEKMGIFA